MMFGSGELKALSPLSCWPTSVPPSYKNEITKHLKLTPDLALLNTLHTCQVTSVVSCQASLSMGFPRQEYWSEFPFLPPGTEPVSLKSTALAGGFFTTSILPGKPKPCLNC